MYTLNYFSVLHDLNRTIADGTMMFCELIMDDCGIGFTEIETRGGHRDNHGNH